MASQDIWLIAESWKQIDEWKGLETLLAATSDAKRNALELQRRSKSREVLIRYLGNRRLLQIAMISELCNALRKSLHGIANLSIVM